jgi:hypothetical protein
VEWHRSVLPTSALVLSPFCLVFVAPPFTLKISEWMKKVNVVYTHNGMLVGLKKRRQPCHLLPPEWTWGPWCECSKSGTEANTHYVTLTWNLKCWPHRTKKVTEAETEAEGIDEKLAKGYTFSVSQEEKVQEIMVATAKNNVLHSWKLLRVDIKILSHNKYVK